jgi:hypothetical protein
MALAVQCPFGVVVQPLHICTRRRHPCCQSGGTDDADDAPRAVERSSASSSGRLALCHCNSRRTALKVLPGQMMYLFHVQNANADDAPRAVERSSASSSGRLALCHCNSRRTSLKVLPRQMMYLFHVQNANACHSGRDTQRSTYPIRLLLMNETVSHRYV